MAEYNPFYNQGQQFAYYTPVSPTKVETTKINDSLYGEIELPKGYRINNSGIVIAKANMPESQNYDFSLMDSMHERHSEQQDNNFSFSTMNPQNQTQSQIVKSDLQGNKQKAFNYFKGKVDNNGNQILSDFQIAGLIGNLIQESNLNPDIVNKSSGAYGLAQWLGNRKKALFKKYGNNPTFDQQLEFIWEELNTTERNAFLHLLTTKSYEDSTRSIMDKFERPSKKEKDESIARRLKNARSLLS